MPNKIHRAILEYQRTNKVPDWQMCNILDLSESDYNAFSRGRGFPLSTFQKIAFVESTQQTLPD